MAVAPAGSALMNFQPGLKLSVSRPSANSACAASKKIAREIHRLLRPCRRDIFWGTKNIHFIIAAKPQRAPLNIRSIQLEILTKCNDACHAKLIKLFHPLTNKLPRVKFNLPTRYCGFLWIGRGEPVLGQVSRVGTSLAG